MKPWFSKNYSPQLLRQHPNKIFVFGDNLAKFGKGGQAIIRGEKNVFGVPTKRYPSFADGSFFSDQGDEFKAVIDSLRELWILGRSHELVFPAFGVGTGLARMNEESPLLFDRMNQILDTHFRVLNGQYDDRRIL